eukprot:TRINITY_DN2888_c0_g2_i3.p3 TRINITY_DN2888_c0_g2~~TRINITY_DN2888_c0_g2_i3.p3  ORF type:complete len:264 (-),score=15.33 TRINITY_DN2888_c0_g2_i3:704-1495(-)
MINQPFFCTISKHEKKTYQNRSKIQRINPSHVNNTSSVPTIYPIPFSLSPTTSLPPPKQSMSPSLSPLTPPTQPQQPPPAQLSKELHFFSFLVLFYLHTNSYFPLPDKRGYPHDLNPNNSIHAKHTPTPTPTPTPTNLLQELNKYAKLTPSNKLTTALVHPPTPKKTKTTKQNPQQISKPAKQPPHSSSTPRPLSPPHSSQPPSYNQPSKQQLQTPKPQFQTLQYPSYPTPVRPTSLQRLHSHRRFRPQLEPMRPNPCRDKGC